MHAESMSYVAQSINAIGFNSSSKAVVEFGSYDVNGSVRPLFPGAFYIGVDRRAGRGVDVVANAQTWGEPECCDVVVTTSTLEHCVDPEAVIANAYRILKPGGWLILTTVGEPWGRHSDDGFAFTEGTDTYTDLTPLLVLRYLDNAGFTDVDGQKTPAGDIFARGQKPKAKKR